MPTTPMQRGGPRHSSRGRARREEILGAALEVIAERGYRGASIQAVAEKVGLTQQGLLHYFPTKEDLLIEVLRHRDEWDAGGDPEQVEMHWTLEHFRLVNGQNAARPEIIRTFSALLGESVTEEHPAGDYFRDRYRGTRARVEAVLGREFGERLPSGLTPAEAAPILVAVMDGLQFQWLHDPERLDMVAAFDAFVRLLQGGEKE